MAPLMLLGLLVPLLMVTAQTAGTSAATRAPSCRAVVDFVATGLREEASRARTVAHLRVESIQPVREWTIDNTCYTGSQVTAVVVNDLGGRRPGTRIRFVPIKNPVRPPYAPGDEVVVALDEDRASHRYFSWGYGNRVRNGVVALTAPLDEFEEEVPVAVLFERLKDGAGARR